MVIDLNALNTKVANVSVAEGEAEKIDEGTEASSFLTAVLAGAGVVLQEGSDMFRELAKNLVGLTKDQALAMVYTLLTKMETKGAGGTIFDGTIQDGDDTTEFTQLLASTLGGGASVQGTGLCGTGEGKLDKLHDIFTNPQVRIAGQTTEVTNDDKVIGVTPNAINAVFGTANPQAVGTGTITPTAVPPARAA